MGKAGAQIKVVLKYMVLFYGMVVMTFNVHMRSFINKEWFLLDLL